jgi:membrane fusion protein, multidrug efflux system
MRSIAAVVVLILGLILYKVGCTGKKEDAKVPLAGSAPSASPGGGKGGYGGGDMPISVDVVVAESVVNTDEIFASGSLVANEEVELRSEASGRVIALYFKEGSAVNKGQLIAKINDADILARLKKLKYEAELAANIEARQKKLLDINAISREEYEVSLNKTNTLSADREVLEVALSQTEIRAPFSGKIGLKNISVGSYLNPGAPIATIVQTNPIKVDFAMPEKYSHRLSNGRQVTLAVEGKAGERNATIIAIDPKIDEALRTVKVRASLSNVDGKFMPGMFVKVNVPLGANKAIMIPTDAIIPFVGGKKIYVLKNGKSEERDIATGLRTDTHVEVLSGLSVGDTIVASGLMNIKNDQKVKVKKVITPTNP